MWNTRAVIWNYMLNDLSNFFCKSVNKKIHNELLFIFESWFFNFDNVKFYTKNHVYICEV